MIVPIDYFVIDVSSTVSKHCDVEFQKRQFIVLSTLDLKLCHYKSLWSLVSNPRGEAWWLGRLSSERTHLFLDTEVLWNLRHFDCTLMYDEFICLLISQERIKTMQLEQRDRNAKLAEVSFNSRCNMFDRLFCTLRVKRDFNIRPQCSWDIE